MTKIRENILITEEEFNLYEQGSITRVDSDKYREVLIKRNKINSEIKKLLLKRNSRMLSIEESEELEHYLSLLVGQLRRIKKIDYELCDIWFLNSEKEYLENLIPNDKEPINKIAYDVIVSMINSRRNSVAGIIIDGDTNESWGKPLRIAIYNYEAGELEEVVASRGTGIYRPFDLVIYNKRENTHDHCDTFTTPPSSDQRFRDYPDLIMIYMEYFKFAVQKKMQIIKEKHIPMEVMANYRDDDEALKEIFSRYVDSDTMAELKQIERVLKNIRQKLDCIYGEDTDYFQYGRFIDKTYRHAI